MCENIPETVFHFIMNCPKYNLPRQKVIKGFSTCNLKLPLNGDNNLTFQQKYYLELCMDFLCQLCSFLKTMLCYLKQIFFVYFFNYYSFFFSLFTRRFKNVTVYRFLFYIPNKNFLRHWEPPYPLPHKQLIKVRPYNRNPESALDYHKVHCILYIPLLSFCMFCLC